MPLLILHGFNGNEPEHWQSWLAEQAGLGGIDVRYPSLPTPSMPSLGPWLDSVLPLLHSEDGELDVVAHSLGCHLWGHVAAASGRVIADRVLLVAPPSIDLVRREIPTFEPSVLNRDLLLACADTRLLLGEGDPWLPDPSPLVSSGLPVEWVAGGAHLNVEAGYGPWPAMMRWVYGVDVPAGGWAR